MTLQPGTLDIGRDPGNAPAYDVGTVTKFWPLTEGASNSIDAAISWTNPAFTKTEILGIGQPRPIGVFPTLAKGVVKSGRTTGVTVGTVEGINVTVTVNYGAACGTYTFVGQTSVFGISPGAFSNQPGYQGNPFSRAGDSGSASLDSTTLSPVGLLFAGSPLLTFGNPISEVYRLLNVLPDSPGGGGPSPMSVEELRAMEDSLQNTLDPQLMSLEEIQARYEGDLLRLPGVQGIGVGLDETGRRLAFHVYVRERTPELESAVPRQIETVPVRLIETGGDIVAQ
jgi:hypothetical protein